MANGVSMKANKAANGGGQRRKKSFIKAGMKAKSERRKAAAWLLVSA